MANNNKKCLLCGKEFKFCPTCQQKSAADAWKNIFDKEECRTIFHLACDYAQGEVDADTAKKILSGCDLSNKDSFKPEIVTFINNILSAPVVDEKEDETRSEEIEEEIIVEKVAPKKMRKGNKK